MDRKLNTRIDGKRYIISNSWGQIDTRMDGERYIISNSWGKIDAGIDGDIDNINKCMQDRMSQ